MLRAVRRRSCNRAFLMTTPLADVRACLPLLVFGHLRWGEHWQRPQQLCARLAQQREVLFVEPPRFLDDVARPGYDATMAYPGVHRLIPRLPVVYRHSENVAQVTVRRLLLELTGPHGALGERFDTPILWFTTPRPAPVMVGAFSERLIVYDPLPHSAARDIPESLFRAHEDFLLHHANLVLSDRDRRAATRLHPDATMPDGNCTGARPSHRTEQAWDLLANDVHQLLREVSANRRPAAAPHRHDIFPGWLAAQVHSGHRR